MDPLAASNAPPSLGTHILPSAVCAKEACRLTGIDRSKLYLSIREGDTETVKVQSMTLIRYSSLRALLKMDGR